MIITESTKHSVVLGGPVKTEPPSPGVSPTPVAPPPMVNVTNSVKPESVNLLNQPGELRQERMFASICDKNSYQWSELRHREEVSFQLR